MDASAVHRMLSSIVPFVNTVGLQITEVGPGSAVAILENTKPVQNHLGSVHAGALYTLGESATGAVVLGLFGDLMPNVFIALKSATVAHTKARQGDLKATARLAEEAAAVRAGFDASGKADFEVVVRFAVDETEVATVSYVWAARRPRP